MALLVEVHQDLLSAAITDLLAHSSHTMVSSPHAISLRLVVSTAGIVVNSGQILLFFKRT